MATGPDLSATHGRHISEPILSASATSQAGLLTAQRVDGRDAILAALATLEPNTSTTGFQAAPWINLVYRHLVPAARGQATAVLVRCSNAASTLAVLPLYVRQEGPFRIARFADCGVSDYNALLTSGASPALAPQAFIAAIKSALKGIDVLELERMPVSPEAPLTQHPSAIPSRMAGNTLSITGTVDQLMRSRAKKFRKEVERCYRLLDAEGAWSFERAQTPTDIEAAISALERQQADRHAHKGDSYTLAAPQFAAFYRDVLLDAPGLGHIFTLKMDGTIIAVLMGIAHNDTFTLLRIAYGGEAWRHLSPGRLVVVEAMKFFCARGVTTFDMGIGDYAFKRSFGTQPTPLVDLVIPLSLKGMAYASTVRLKAKLRANQRVRSIVQSVKSRFGNHSGH